MFDDKGLDKDIFDDVAELDMKFKKEDCCVCINVYTRCDKNHPWKKDDKCGKDKKEDCCVCINVYTECEK